MRVTLAYGKQGLAVEVPDGRLMKVLSMRPRPPLADAEAAVADAVARPLAGPPLTEIAGGRRSACINICDITRPAPNAVMLPPVLAALQAAGIGRDNILILIATGLHRGNTPDELKGMVGPEVFGKYRIENHDARDRGAHVDLGRTRRGTPVLLDRRFVQAEVRITAGYIEPHLMAGFSGARKLVAPGVAAAETIRVLHGPTFIEHPACCEGVLDGNILHDELTEIADLAGLSFTVNTALDEPRRVTGVFAGEHKAAFRAGAAFVAEQAADVVPEPADVVLTSAGGFPLDLTFYQAVKGMTAALPILKPGGTMLVAGECSEGLGGHEFAALATQTRDLKQFMADIRRPDYFVIDQWQLEELVKVLERGEVVLCGSKIAPPIAARLPVKTAADTGAALAAALERHGPEARVAVIPKGPYLIAKTA
jgi:nickel-dependent lactate racemase